MSAPERGRLSTPVVLLIIGAAFLVYRLQFVLLPFIGSGLLAYICNPLIDRLASSTRLSRSLSAVAVFLALLSLASFVGFFALPLLLHEFTRSLADFQGALTRLLRSAIGDGSMSFLGRSMTAAEMAQAAMSAARDWIEQPGKMLQIGGIAVSTLFGSLLSLVLLFYFLYSGPDVMRGLFWLVPPERRAFTLDVWARLDPVLRRYFLGVLAVVTYAAIAAYIGLGLILHLPYSIFLAVLTGFLETIPMIGPAASAAIAGIVAVHHATSIEAIIGYAVYAAALRLSIDQFVGPLVLGRAAQLHPIAIIFCFITGGVLFGITGFILAIPTALVIRTCLAVSYGDAAGRNARGSEQNH